LNANSRREFLRALSASLGGALLTVGPLGLLSCSDSSTVANAYSFHSVRQGTGKILFDQSPSAVGAVTYADAELQPLHFIADPMLTDDGQVVFEAYDINGVLALYSIQISFSGRTPVAQGQRTVVQVGQAVDSLIVDHIDGVDVSANGVLGLVLSVADAAGKVRHALYAERHGALSKIAVEGDMAQDGHTFSGIFHDVSINDENALFVARYLHQAADVADQTPSLGLFVVPLDASSLPRLLVQQGDLPLSADYPLSGLGLIDLHGQNYIASGSVVVKNPGNTDPPSPDGKEQIILLGTLDGRQPIVIAAGPLLSGVVDSSVHIGDQLSTPRIEDGSPVFTLLKDGNHNIFDADGARTTAGAKSPSGLTPVLLSPAVPAAGGSMFHLQTVVAGATLDDGSESKRELIHTDISNVSTLLLTTGDQLVNDARKIWDISFGSFRRHVDIHRNLAALVLFNDPSVTPGSVYPAALIIGVPV
jgi:hypothetical protein